MLFPALAFLLGSALVGTLYQMNTVTVRGAGHLNVEGDLRTSMQWLGRDMRAARAIAGHVRNVPDSILAVVGRQGGVVLVNFAPQFISEEVRRYDAEWGSSSARYRALQAADSTAARDSLRAWVTRSPRATLAQVADHMDHIRRVCGRFCVGLGSDFDGISSVPAGLEDVSRFPDLLAELLRRGWSEEDLKLAAGLNALRVLRAAERVAREMER